MAAAQGYSAQKLGDIEAGTRAVKQNDAIELLRFFHVTGDDYSHLMSLRLLGEQGSDVTESNVSIPREGRLFLDLEAHAERIDVFESEYVPGLFQTVAYMEAVQAAEDATSPDTGREIRRDRVGRQTTVLERADGGPTVRTVIGFAAIHYLAQLPSVTRDEQLSRLRVLAARPNVSIRVVDRLHPGMMSGPFTIVVPPSGEFDVPVVYLEGLGDRSYLEKPDAVAPYRDIFERVYDVARDIEEYLS
ncbi:hypothetical protein HNR73_006220 [Phytomonospora endophytica]|uniref:DUF5753 domain-containing protein n=1 Tax=Phytomonospora endophytica TaxID=714109 RepID=A0A841FYB0_9ACTN|nr:hypothetical protein [Phytomonospora endophytica]